MLLTKENKRVMGELSAKFEDIRWSIQAVPTDVTDMLGFDAFLMIGTKDGEVKEFVIPKKSKQKQKLEWGNAIGAYLYEVTK